MSTQRNVQLVRKSFEAFAGGDFDTAFAAYDPDSEWRTSDDEPDAQTYRSVGELRRFAASLAELWLDRFEHTQRFEEFIDCGDWVVAPWSARLRGRGSGVEVEVSETYAVRVRDGKIVRVEEYRTKEEALEAVRRRG
jgi:uncharacterized protein